MTLSVDEFIRRFLLHVLPKGFHRIRHYGLPASAGCKASIAHAKELHDAQGLQLQPSTCKAPVTRTNPCRCFTDAVRSSTGTITVIVR